MDTRKYIGFYVHHHGTGHLTRTLQIVRHLQVPVKIFCSREKPADLPEAVKYIRLPSDVDEAATSGSTPEFLHYASTRSNAVAERMHQIADSCKDVRMLVVDVSVEVTLLARLLSIPTFVTLMHGKRSDTAHILAYQSAEGLIATYPAALEQPERPSWIVDKTMYVGLYSKMSLRAPIAAETACKLIGIDGRMVLVASSLGGDGVSLDTIAALASKAPSYTWVVAGIAKESTGTLPKNVRYVGVQDDMWPYLCAADVVIGSGGNNTIAEIAAANKPTILVPEPRPFDEQYHNVKSLSDAGIAMMYETMEALASEPVAEILDKLCSQPVRWTNVVDTAGPEKIAAHLTSEYERLVW